MASESKRIVIIAFVNNLAIALIKFIVAFFSSSSAMLAEAIHSTADSFNQLLLFIGMNRSEKAPDKKHPFGYGNEQYFWSFIVAIFIFAVGALFSLYEGIHKLMYPSPINHVFWNFVVLFVSIILESISFYSALKEVNKNRHGKSLLSYSRESKDQMLITVMMEDLAALLGLIIALVGTLAFYFFNDTIFDAISSILIGLLLAVVAFFLTKEARGLLVGEAASDADEEKIRNAILSHECVVSINELLTLHFGAKQILVNAHVKFDPSMNLSQVEIAIDEIEEKIIEAVPKTYKIFIETHQRKDRTS